MKNWLRILLILTIFGGISIYVNFKFQGMLDPDSLYHIRHAWIYQTNGIFDSSFPWTQFSVIRTMGADLWYGFHIFLIPLTYISDLVVAIKVASIFITFLVLVSFYAAFKNIYIKFPELWAIIFLLSSSSIMARMTMTRPHPLSLGLTALIFSFFYKGPATLVFVFSFILSWIHSSIDWFPIIAVCVLILFQWLNKQEVDIRKVIAFLAGIATGLMARPHPLANLKLIYIQVVDLYLSKNHELVQIIGAELRPPTGESVDAQMWLFITLISALVYLGWYLYKKESLDINRKITILSSLTLTVFSILMYITARRAIDQLGLFITIFTGLVFSLFSSRKKGFLAAKERSITILLFSLLLSISAYNLIYANFSSSHSPTKFKESALWLKENTKEKDVVFYLSWSNFPFLFFWNQSNYYINGMDPVFLLKYDRKLYWKLYNMAVNEDDKKLYWRLDNKAVGDMGGITCGYDPKQCGPENIEIVSNVLRNDFHASYVFITHKNQARFLDYLQSDTENFKKVYEEKEHVIIFKVL